MSATSSVPVSDSSKAKLYDCRDAYSQALEAMAEADPRGCAVVSDSVSSTKLKSFSQKFPDRFVNVGIAEQNLVGVGAVAEILAVHHPAPMRILGVPGVFAPTGSAEFLLEHFGLTAEGIEKAALELVDRGAQMANECMLAVDQETTNTKALLFDREGKAIFSASFGVALMQPKPGYVEQDLMEIWRSVCQVVRDCVVHARQEGATIA